MKTRLNRLLLLVSMPLLALSCKEKEGPEVIPPEPKPSAYECTVRPLVEGETQVNSITAQDDGSWFIDWNGYFDAFFFLDITLNEDEKAAGLDYSQYNVLEFEVKGVTAVTPTTPQGPANGDTPLIIYVGGTAYPTNCSDCKNVFPVSEDWVKVTCDLAADGAQAGTPWTWVRIGIGANAATPTFYIRNIRIINPDAE